VMGRLLRSSYRKPVYPTPICLPMTLSDHVSPTQSEWPHDPVVV